MKKTLSSEMKSSILEATACPMRMPSDFKARVITQGRAAGFVMLSDADKAYYGGIEKGTAFVPKTAYADGSYSLCVASVAQYGAAGDGVTDDYQAFCDAMAAASAMKGGVVFVPRGTYYVSRPLHVPHNVHLRGEYDSPEHTAYGDGTNIVTDYAQTGIYNTPFVMLSSTSGVRNMAFYYLNQNFENPVDYSPCVGLDPSKMINSATVQNIMVYNSTYPLYFGTASGSMEVNYVWATPLKIGMLSDNDGSVANFANLHMDEKYYAECGFVGAPQNDSDRQKLRETLKDAIAYIFERHDAPFLTAVYSHGIGTGLIVRQSSHPQRNTWPNSGGFDGGCSLNTFEFTGCHTGIRVQELLCLYTLSGGRIESSGADGSVGICITEACTTFLMLNGITVDGAPDVAVENRSHATVHLTACDLNSWKKAGVFSCSGSLYLSACTFGGTGNEVLADHTEALGLSGCTFAADSPTVSTVGIAKNRLAWLSYDMPALAQRKNDPYQYAEKIPGPKKFDLYNALDYGVDNTGGCDVTDGMNRLLKMVGDNGGGIVYMPVGEYRLEGTLVVPTGVELRGASEAANTDNTHYGWTRLDVYGGKGRADGDGAIVLREGAGIKGFYLYYPEQNAEGYQDGQEYTPYPYSVTAKGPNCYAMFVDGVNSYQMFDFGSAPDCSNYYIYCCCGQPLKVGFFLGNNYGVGRVERCVFSLVLWAYTGLPSAPHFGPGTYDAFGMATNPLWNAFVWDLLNNATGIVFGYNEKVYSMSNGAFAMGTLYKFVEQNGQCTKNASIFYTSADVTYDTVIVEKAENIEMVFNIPNMWLKKGCGATVTGFTSIVNTVQWEVNKHVGIHRVEDGKMTFVGAGMSLYPIPCMFEVSGGELNVVGGLMVSDTIDTLVRASGGKTVVSGVILHHPTADVADSSVINTESSGDANVLLNGCMNCENRWHW